MEKNNFLKIIAKIAYLSYIQLFPEYCVERLWVRQEKLVTGDNAGDNFYQSFDSLLIVNAYKTNTRLILTQIF